MEEKNIKSELVKAIEQLLMLKVPDDVDEDELMIVYDEDYYGDYKYRFGEGKNQKDYKYDERLCCFEKEIILKCKLKSTCMRIIIDDDVGVAFKFPVGITTDDGNVMRTMEFITRANFGQDFGGFRMDTDNNYVEYAVYIRNMDPTTVYSTFLDAMELGARMVERYGDELLEVMFGRKNAKDAVEAAERKVL